MSWAERADAMIAKIDAGLPEGSDLKALRRALRENASAFHGGTSWGRRVWGRRCRVHLARYGVKPRAAPPPTFAADIVFPWRRGTPA